jgi:hypothetical protein
VGGAKVELLPGATSLPEEPSASGCAGSGLCVARHAVRPALLKGLGRTAVKPSSTYASISEAEQFPASAKRQKRPS